MRLSHWVSVVGAVAVVATGLTACGGGSNEVVAQVAGVGSITKATLDHWVPIEAVLLYQEVPKKEVPSGVVPDPPTFAACIAHLEATGQKGAAGGTAELRVQLKHKCQAAYQNLKVYALNTLINWEWTIGQSAAWGVKVSDAEVARHLKEMKSAFFATDTEFKKYLKWTRQTTADMAFRARVGVIETKLGQKLSSLEKLLPKKLNAHQREQALTGLTSGLPNAKQLVAMTSCRPGYVTSDCREYKGAGIPGTPN